MPFNPHFTITSAIAQALIRIEAVSPLAKQDRHEDERPTSDDQVCSKQRPGNEACLLKAVDLPPGVKAFNSLWLRPPG